MTENVLKFSYDSNGDGSGALRLEFQTLYCSSVGEAWFDDQMLETIAASFAHYPLSPDESYVLEGGLYDNNTHEVSQAYLHISARPLDMYGATILRLRVSEPLDMDAGQTEPSYYASVELRTDYEGMLGLSKGLVSLARLETDRFEVTL